MMPVDAAIYAVAAWGHAALWISAANHLQALALPRWLLSLIAWPMRLTSVVGAAAGVVLGGPIYDRLHLIGSPPGPGETPLSTLERVWLAYVGSCIAIAIVFLPRWLWWVVRHARHQTLDHHALAWHRLREQVKRERVPLKTRFFLSLPGNQAFDLSVTEKTLALPRLPAALDGVSIAHLSDLHLTGQLPSRWYDEVMRITNDLQADLIVITGDLVEKVPCLDWLGPIFGQLRATHGVYFVLGNHDTRIDYRRTRRELVQAGLIDLGGTWHAVDIRERPVFLAGNELPWLKPAADPRLPPVTSFEGEPPLRIAAAHSPDQFSWAKENGFDLLLAGHTHGGQIRLPGLGPIVCPSRHNGRYASGSYHEPPTVMHVSRGVAGDTLLRYNCPPEVTRLVLRAAVRPELVEDEAPSATVPVSIS